MNILFNLLHFFGFGCNSCMIFDAVPFDNLFSSTIPVR